HRMSGPTVEAEADKCTWCGSGASPEPASLDNRPMIRRRINRLGHYGCLRGPPAEQCLLRSCKLDLLAPEHRLQHGAHRRLKVAHPAVVAGLAVFLNLYVEIAAGGGIMSRRSRWAEPA